jgi:hypothetical protein
MIITLKLLKSQKYNSARTFVLDIVLSVFLRFTTSDYSFDIFKLSFYQTPRSTRSTNNISILIIRAELYLKKDRQYNDQKKSLKMSKEYSEVVNQRKTDNTMTKRKA